MEYDPHKIYHASAFEQLSPEDLQAVFEEAKKVVDFLFDFRTIRKVSKDLTTMRNILKGMNRNHNIRKENSDQKT